MISCETCLYLEMCSSAQISNSGEDPGPISDCYYPADDERFLERLSDFIRLEFMDDWPEYASEYDD